MIDQNDNDMTKRRFLQSVGMIGGSAAMYTAMQGLNMVHASTMTEPPKMATSGKGKKLIILGAGLSGMVTAIEMRKKGYDCKILEARSFVGGRCQSARKGHIIEDVGGETQVCNFADGQYLNIGPWRIPAEHHSTLYYCRTLGVKLEPLINKSSQSYYYSDKAEGALKGTPVRKVHAEIDRQGNIAELLAKCAADGSLDDKISKEDSEMLLEYLRHTRLIDRKTLEYKANRARGYQDYPGTAMHIGKLSKPYKLNDLLKFKVGTAYETADHPAVMFQAVGGMDQIAMAMYKSLPRNLVTLNAEVTTIAQDDDGVDVTYINTKSGKHKTVRADYCISAIPFPVLTKINHDFSPEVIDALKAPTSAPAFKLGLQLSRRFWEQEEMIYGGTSVTDIPGHGVTSYPSSDLHSNKGGVLLSSYVYYGAAVKNSNLTVAQRNEFALSIGEKLHPGKFRKYYTGNAISMAWHRQKYNMCGWLDWSSRNHRRKLPILLKGEKRVLFTGNGISPSLPGWMAGAIEGAWYTMADLDKRVAKG